jgi:hypothetical protein
VKRRLWFPGALLGAVSAVRAALARAGGRVRVDKAAQQEVLRALLADAARRRVRAGLARAAGESRLAEVTRRIERAAELLAVIEAGRRDEPAKDEPRLARVACRIERAAGLLAVIEAARRDELAAEALGFARPLGGAGGARQREARRGGLEIGR